MKKLLILAGIVISAASFGHAKLTDLGGSGGGTGGGATGATGPAGPAGSAVYAQTSVGGASTTITDLAIITQVNGPLVELKGSSYTIDLTTTAMVNSSQTYTGSPTLQSPWNAFNTSTWAFKLQSMGASPYPFPIIVGNNSSNNPSGIAWVNGTMASTSSASAAWMYQGITNRGMWFEIRGRRYIFMNEDTKGVGIGTETPAYALEVASASGSGGMMAAVSTGATHLFEVTGTSINMTAVPVFLGSTTINGGVTMNGTGASSITPLNGPLTIAGDMPFPTTWYTGVAFPFDSGVSSRIVTGSIYGQNGRFLGDGQYSSGTTNCGYFQKWVSKYYIAGTTPTLTDIVEISSGLISQQSSWIIDFATQSVVSVSTGLTYSNAVIVPITGTTLGTGGMRTAAPEVTIPGLWSILGSGRKFLIVRARRDGANATTDPAQSDTAIGEIAFDIRVQK